MAIQPNYELLKISKINGIGADAVPNRFVQIKASDPKSFIKPVVAGAPCLGVLLPDLRYEEGKTPDGKAGSIMVAGIIDAECAATIPALHYVKVDIEGRLLDVGSADGLSLSDGTTQVGIVGINLEAGEEGSKVAVQLIPQVAFLA